MRIFSFCFEIFDSFVTHLEETANVMESTCSACYVNQFKINTYGVVNPICKIVPATHSDICFQICDQGSDFNDTFWSSVN